MEKEKFEEHLREGLKKEGVFYTRIKVIPNSSNNKIIQILKDAEQTVKISIKATPEKGKANEELCRFLSKTFQCQCTIISGHINTVKLIKLSQF